MTKPIHSDAPRARERTVAARILLVPMAVGLISGCAHSITHIHDERRAAIANDTAKVFGEARTSSGGPFAVMLVNLGKIAEATKERQQAATNATIRAVAQAVPTLTWGQIRSELRRCSASSDAYRREILNALDSANSELKDATALKETLDASVEGTRKTLVAAMDQAAMWEARQILFRKGIEIVVKDAETSTPLTDETSLKAAKDILEQEMTVTKLNEAGEIVTDKTKVGDQLKGDVKNLKALDLGGLLRAYTVHSVDPKSAPGLTVVILSLGDDLARMQEQRAQLELNHLSTRLALLQDAQGTDHSCEVAIQIIDDRVLEGHFKHTAKPVDTINQLKNRTDDQPLQDGFKVLAYYSIARVLNTARRDDLRVRLAVLEHEYEIRLAQVNAREREAVIGRGLEGLVAYHSGGLTAEDIANLLRAAQTAGLAAIGAGVN